MAEAEHDCAGLGGEFRLGPARAARRYFLSKGRRREAAAVDYIVAGALCDPVPKADGSFDDTQKCQRCGGERVATRLHDLWLCEDNAKCGEDEVVETQGLRREACLGWRSDKCLWARGIMLAGLAAKKPDVARADAATWATGDFGGIVDRGGFIFTDGAGPQGRSCRPGSHVHAGAVAVRPGPRGGEAAIEEVAAVMGQVPGKQTVPRAEIWALVLAVGASPKLHDIEVGVDASYVVGGCTKEALMACSINGDLWSSLFGLVAGRGGTVSVRKVESHLVDKGVARIVACSPIAGDVVGNALADTAATIARQLDGCDGPDAGWEFAYGRTVKVVKRLAVIQARIWASRDNARLFRPPPGPEGGNLTKKDAVHEVLSMVSGSGHRVTVRNGGFLCLNCGRWRKKLRSWAKEPCKGKRSAAQLVASHRLDRALEGWSSRGAECGGPGLSCSPVCGGGDVDGGMAVEDSGDEVVLTSVEVSFAAASQVDDSMADVRDDVPRLGDQGPRDEAAAQPCETTAAGAPPGSEGQRPPPMSFGLDEETPMDDHAPPLQATPFDFTSTVGIACEEPPSEMDLVAHSAGVDDAARDAGECDLGRNVRRRRSQKIPAANTAYAAVSGLVVRADSGLLTLREYRAAVARNAAKRRKVSLESRETMSDAWDFVARTVQAGTIVGEQRPSGAGGPRGPADLQVHGSHDLRLARGIGVAYCNVCDAGRQA